MSPLPPDVDLRFAAPTDVEAVMALVRACYGDAAESTQWWRWRHFHESLAWSRVCIAERDGQVIGIRPAVVFDYTLAGRRMKGGFFSAVMVHPDHRRRGVFKALVAASLSAVWEQGAELVSVHPNDLSVQGFRAAGWREPGLRPLFMAPLIGPALRRRVAKASRAAPEIRILSAERFDGRADGLADVVAERVGGYLLRRDRAWLSWRFDSAPERPYRRLLAVRGDELLGWVVTVAERRKGVELGWIVDLLAVRSEVSGLLTARALADLRQSGCRVGAAVATDPQVQASLRAGGLKPIPDRIAPKRFYLMWTARPGAKGLAPLENVEGWYQTLGDWDGL